MIWLFQKNERIIRGYFPSKGSFNIIEWRPEGWRLTRNEGRPEVGAWYKEMSNEDLEKSKAFRNTLHVILENPEDVKREWK